MALGNTASRPCFSVSVQARGCILIDSWRATGKLAVLLRDRVAAWVVFRVDDSFFDLRTRLLTEMEFTLPASSIVKQARQVCRYLVERRAFFFFLRGVSHLLSLLASCSQTRLSRLHPGEKGDAQKPTNAAQ